MNRMMHRVESQWMCFLFPPWAVVLKPSRGLWEPLLKQTPSLLYEATSSFTIVGFGLFFKVFSINFTTATRCNIFLTTTSSLPSSSPPPAPVYEGPLPPIILVSYTSPPPPPFY
ncbi:Leucine-rich repeat family protein [Gossypium australe]|uniref:Leucine-rich repeat family protein n=1 Tax=Gossypium australe TaxID=47621 RepID=A0A5B6W8S0_9ROSI|nr:Leucine-rich repeat family protein [Gossypium australe]